MKGERKGIRKLIFPMEQVAGIEPAPSAWKTDILAVIRYLHMERIEGIEPSTKPWQGLVLPLNYIRIKEGDC